MNRDSTVKRFHFNLTNMPSWMRNALKYDGKTLISLDIKNSQPYMSLLLLDPNFWCLKSSKISDEAQNPSKTIKSSNKLTIHHIINKTSPQLQTSYTMLVESVKPLLNRDFTSYISAVTSGTFYEYLNNQIRLATGVAIEDRKQLKDVMFLVLFGANGYRGLESRRKLFKEVFEKSFPNINELFQVIKKQKKNTLACLLQSIESHLILDVITKLISEKYPRAPLFTIHDSIATTEDYAQDVYQMMVEKLSEYIGYPPKLAMEEWKEENILKESHPLVTYSHTLDDPECF
ncbi:hypothetical protein [Nonlabens sp. YIK11]|uniref:hypothetical protein n=1 Tax=Nonlabens sp. YIK11 TaxID=1453349 RepID=UPI0012E0CEF4|nr:hypothetical protein [Nonlabens sp. YIK11]